MNSTSIQSARLRPSPSLKRVEIGAGQNYTSIEIFGLGQDIAVFQTYVRSHPKGGFYRSEPIVIASGITSIAPPAGKLDLMPGAPLPEGTSSGGIEAGGEAAAVMLGLPGNGITRAFATWDTRGVYAVGFEAACTGNPLDSTDFMDITILITLH